MRRSRVLKAVVYGFLDGLEALVKFADKMWPPFVAVCLAKWLGVI